MEEKGVIKVIKENIKVLPESQRTVGEYILSNSRKVANLSALDLGAMAGVSDATVVRFSKSLGYAGYNEMKNELLTYLTREDNPSEKMIKSINSVKKVNSAVADVFENDIRNIQETFTSMSKEMLENAADIIYKGRRIFILGLNSCGALASFLNFHLRRLTLDVHLITSAGLVMFEHLGHLNSEDILVIISYPRYSQDSYHAVQLANKRGAKVVSITDKSYSPIAELSDYPLVAHSSSPGFYNSYAAATTMCNALVLSIALIDKEKSLQALKQIEEVKKDIYL